MPRVRRLPALSLFALALSACAHSTTPPTELAATPRRAVDPAPAIASPPARYTQVITFDDDPDPDPTARIQGAPKRAPIPAFALYGTRVGDGP